MECEASENDDLIKKMSSDTFYTDAKAYWESVPATVNGVMGGFANLSSCDITGSKKFLLPFIQGPTAFVPPDRALDCGAGIGRVSKRLLLPLFKEVDLEEPNSAFLEKIQGYLGESGKRIGHYFPVGLQEFTPQERHYNVIWCQWVLSHLRDSDLVSFLQRCILGLVPNHGVIIVKENVSTDEDDFDDEDSSVTRCMETFLRIFSEANLCIVKQENQPKWPGNMFPVTMFALAPNSSKMNISTCSS